MKFYPALHTLRGFAAIWVLLLHVWFFSGATAGFFGTFFSFGWLGVRLFYLLSAFLLGSTYFYHKKNGTWNIYHFYTRRFLRIFPAYYVQLIVILILSYYVDWYTFPKIKELIAHLFMFFNLPPTYTQPINGVWWTLPVEFLFYLLLPALIIIMIKLKPIAFIVVSITITITFRYYVYQHFSELRISSISKFIGQLPGMLVIFSLGLVSSYLVDQNKVLKLSNWWLILSLIALIIWAQILLMNLNEYWSGSPLLFTWEVVTAFILTAILLTTYNSNNRIFTHKILVWFGKISYGIYLWHIPIILFFKDNTTGFLQLLLIVFPLTLITASLSYYLIENKVSKLKF